MTEEQASDNVRPINAASPPARSSTRILLAARELFAEHGLEGVTMDDVARRARVSRATVFNRFDSKRGLVEAITADVLSGYIELLEDELKDRDSAFEDQVRRLFERMGAGIEASRRFYRAIFREITKISLGIDEGGMAEAARRTAADRLEQLVTRWQARREVADDLDARDVAMLFDSVIFGIITRWLFSDEQRSLREDMSRMSATFIRMVSPSSS